MTTRPLAQAVRFIREPARSHDPARMNRSPVFLRRLAAPFVALMLALAFAAGAAAKTPPTEVRKIEALIAAVEARPDAVFIRNGGGHDAEAAADHLRLKWKHAGSRIRTARDFIRYCATKSSMTGRKYRIRFGDGREVEAAVFFEAELQRIEAAGVTRPAGAQ